MIDLTLSQSSEGDEYYGDYEDSTRAVDEKYVTNIVFVHGRVLRVLFNAVCIIIS